MFAKLIWWASDSERNLSATPVSAFCWIKNWGQTAADLQNLPRKVTFSATFNIPTHMRSYERAIDSGWREARFCIISVSPPRVLDEYKQVERRERVERFFRIGFAEPVAQNRWYTPLCLGLSVQPDNSMLRVAAFSSWNVLSAYLSLTEVDVGKRQI